MSEFNPAELSPKGQKAYAAIQKFLKKHKLSVGDGFFATPETWRERGEEYSRESVLVVVYDGAADLKRAFSLDGYDYKLNEKLIDALHAEGFWYEEGTHWYGGVYEL